MASLAFAAMFLQCVDQFNNSQLIVLSSLLLISFIQFYTSFIQALQAIQFYTSF